MGIIASITKLDRNFGWSFLGFVLAAVFGALSLYTEFWKETAPRLEFELLSSAPVLDVREKLPELEVLYRSQNIQEQGRTLSVLLVRAVNRGSADLLSSHYDSKVPVGLNLEHGTLIRADLAGASNEYLRQAAVVTATSPTISLEPTILEPDEWYLLKLLVLHDVASQPTISAHGKIAGMHSINVVSPSPATEKEGFWFQAFSGGVWTQIVRIPGYFLAAVLLMVGIIIPASSLSDAVTTRKRKKLVERFKAKTKLDITDGDEFIFDGYVNHGLQYVQRVTNTVADPERLQKRVARHFEEDAKPEPGSEVIYSEDFMVTEASLGGRRVYFPGRTLDVGPLIKHGFIVESDGKWLPVPERLRVATSFIDFLELVGSADV
jgi:hypothetical protein